MQTPGTYFLILLVFVVYCSGPDRLLAQTDRASTQLPSRWQCSLQYLGLTCHPEGGNTPQVYPLKLDKKVFLVCGRI